jgi:hypothetical protein
MTRIGVTGHQVIPASGIAFIKGRLREILEAQMPVVLVTSLAAGADQLCAALTLDMGGSIEVIIPARNYRSTLSGDDEAQYDRLLAEAVRVEELPNPLPNEQAFYAAGLRVLDLSNILVAVWDGEPARGLGGTADIVREAKNRGMEAQIVWPRGLRRA